MTGSERTAELATGWIEAWVRMDMDWLRDHLPPDFVHVSPFGRFDDRTTYLATVEPVARKSVAELVILDVIVEIRSFYDSAAIREILSPDEQERLAGGYRDP